MLLKLLQFLKDYKKRTNFFLSDIFYSYDIMCKKDNDNVDIKINDDKLKKKDRKKPKFAQGVDPIFIINDDNI